MDTGVVKHRPAPDEIPAGRPGIVDPSAAASTVRTLLHAHGLAPDDPLPTEVIHAHLVTLRQQDWATDPACRAHVATSLDVLAEHLVGRHHDADKEVKAAIHRFRLEVSERSEPS